MKCDSSTEKTAMCEIETGANGLNSLPVGKGVSLITTSYYAFGIESVYLYFIASYFYGPSIKENRTHFSSWQVFPVALVVCFRRIFLTTTALYFQAAKSSTIIALRSLDSHRSVC